VRTPSDKVGRAAFVRTFPLRSRGLLNGYIFDDEGTIVRGLARHGDGVGRGPEAFPHQTAALGPDLRDVVAMAPIEPSFRKGSGLMGAPSRGGW
jgi:hypothetical protein